MAKDNPLWLTYFQLCRQGLILITILTMIESVHPMTIAVIISSKVENFQWKEFNNSAIAHGYKLVKIDFTKPLEEQADFDVLYSKIHDVIAAADQGNTTAKMLIDNVQNYLLKRPQIYVINPFDKFRLVMDRYKFSKIVEDEPSFPRQGIFTPTFAHFTTNDTATNKLIVKQRGVTYPAICKSTRALGTPFTHDFIVFFNEKSLGACKAPSILQSLINHNAVLYKVMVIGERFYISKRHSLKNLYSSEDSKPIYFTTAQVSKPMSHSNLSVLDPQDTSYNTFPIQIGKVKSIIQVLNRKLGLFLYGVDVIVENTTGRHAIIDINVFNYKNYPNFFDQLFDSLRDVMSESRKQIVF